MALCGLDEVKENPLVFSLCFFPPPSCLSNCGEDEEQAEERGQRWALHLPRPAGRRHPALQVRFPFSSDSLLVSLAPGFHCTCQIISDPAIYCGRGLVPLEKILYFFFLFFFCHNSDFNPRILKSQNSRKTSE